MDSGKKEKGITREERSSLSVHSHCLLLIGYKLGANRFGSPKISLDRFDLDRFTSDRFGSNRFTDSTYYPMHGCAGNRPADYPVLQCLGQTCTDVIHK